MNVIPKENDTITTVIKQRIKYFKDVHERHGELSIRNMCQIKISTLEMILNDIAVLRTLQSS